MSEQNAWDGLRAYQGLPSHPSDTKSLQQVSNRTEERLEKEMGEVAVVERWMLEWKWQTWLRNSYLKTWRSAKSVCNPRQTLSVTQPKFVRDTAEHVHDPAKCVCDAVRIAREPSKRCPRHNVRMQLHSCDTCRTTWPHLPPPTLVQQNWTR